MGSRIWNDVISHKPQLRTFLSTSPYLKVCVFVIEGDVDGEGGGVVMGSQLPQLPYDYLFCSMRSFSVCLLGRWSRSQLTLDEAMVHAGNSTLRDRDQGIAVRAHLFPVELQPMKGGEITVLSPDTGSSWAKELQCSIPVMTSKQQAKNQDDKPTSKSTSGRQLHPQKGPLIFSTGSECSLETMNLGENGCHCCLTNPTVLPGGDCTSS
ncbi:hypothetical protein EYF80_001561 [Liparis tanakae]|uniref:Uncharacterized protein n=1 Tax=Liparis tanakae TaxID=230148 RepID=A0A4Z2JDJ0_9TELE|nr:hypothetical protein EYF80_001561 [Liparis tanakae]